MRSDYRQWLESQKYDANTIQAQIYRATRVEEHYGDLAEHLAKDGLTEVIDALRYTSADARQNRPNPTKIPFAGDIKNNLASYRNAVERYRRFLLSAGEIQIEPRSASNLVDRVQNEIQEEVGQRIGLERDMQAALRKAIEQLEAGLKITDDGAERSVDSGFIDITAQDNNGATVVIELKAGPAGQRAIAQILSYMGDVATEEEGKAVRGILIASDFDAKSKAAAKMVPSLALRKYSVKFMFAEA